MIVKLVGDALSRKSANGPLMQPYNNLPSKSVSDLNQSVDSVNNESFSFGIKGYEVPNTSRSFLYNPRTFKIIESKKKEKDNFITDAVRDRAFVPSPCLYQPDNDKTSMIFKQNLSIYKNGKKR